MEGPRSLINFRGFAPALVGGFPHVMAATGLPLVRKGLGLKFGVNWSILPLWNTGLGSPPLPSIQPQIPPGSPGGVSGTGLLLWTQEWSVTACTVRLRDNRMLAHCLGAVGSGTPATHCHTARDVVIAVRVRLRTATFFGYARLRTADHQCIPELF